MATNIEKRYIRIEDWKGNIYYPESSSGSTTAGIIVDASEASTDPASGSSTFTEGLQSADIEANNGTIILLAANDEPKILFQTMVDNISFGKLVVNPRLKLSSLPSSTVDMIEVRTYYVDNTNTETADVALDTVTFSSKDIINAGGKANEFVDLSFISNFKGQYTGSVSFKVKITMYGGTGSTVYFDQVAVCKAFPGISATK